MTTTLSVPSSAIKCRARSAHFLVTSAMKKEGVDVSREEGAKGLATQHRRLLVLHQDEKSSRHAAHTSLPHSTPLMLCVNTHYPTGPRRAKRPPRSASPTDVGGSLRKPLGPQHEFSTHFNALSGATIESLRCSSNNSSCVLFLPKMLSLSSGSKNYSPLSLGCRTHFFAVILQLFPVFPFNTFRRHANQHPPRVVPICPAQCDQH